MCDGNVLAITDSNETWKEIFYFVQVQQVASPKPIILSCAGPFHFLNKCPDLLQAMGQLEFYCNSVNYRNIGTSPPVIQNSKQITIIFSFVSLSIAAKSSFHPICAAICLRQSPLFIFNEKNKIIHVFV